jgi:hypothetical protein
MGFLDRRRQLAAIAASAALCAATPVLLFLRAEDVRQERAGHAARGETELRIINPAGATLSLLRAGETLEQAPRGVVVQRQRRSAAAQLP